MLGKKTENYEFLKKLKELYKELQGKVYAIEKTEFFLLGSSLRLTNLKQTRIVQLWRLRNEQKC